MTTQNWKSRFEALLAELEAHPDVELTEGRLEAPASDEELQRAAQFLGSALPPALAALYKEFNGCAIGWRHRQWGEDGVGGQIRIFSVGQTFSSRWEEEGQRFLPFDWPADNHFAGFPLEGAPTLQWLESGEVGEPLTETLAAYLDAALAARGMWMWQEAFLYSEARLQRLGAYAPTHQTQSLLIEASRRVFQEVNVEALGGAAACPVSPEWRTISATPTSTCSTLVFGAMHYREQPVAVVEGGRQFVAAHFDALSLFATESLDGSAEIIDAAFIGYQVASASSDGLPPLTSGSFNTDALDFPAELWEQLDIAGDVSDDLGLWLVSPNRNAELRIGDEVVIAAGKPWVLVTQSIVERLRRGEGPILFVDG